VLAAVAYREVRLWGNKRSDISSEYLFIIY